MKIIFDTDLTNEIDDCFALVYILKSVLSSDLGAITLEPYDTFWQDYDNKTTMLRNNLEAYKILRLLDDKRYELIYPGSKYFFSDIKKKENIEAVDKIIEIVKREKTIILATGCLTNIALALEKDTSIADNIKLIWLGGRTVETLKVEFNLRQDIQAAQIVYKYVDDLTMIFSKSIGSAMKIPLDRIKNELSNKNEICNYLLDKYISLDCVKEKGVKTLYDVVVPILLTRPELYTMESLPIAGITDKGEYIVEPTGKLVKYCVGIDDKAVIDELLQIITQ